jgi:ribose transport system ATP-binding protein
MAPSVVSLQAISKTFDSGRALSDVSLDVAPGEIHGLLGENGSGKSTLIKILAGFHEPDAGGRLLVNGREVRLPMAPGQFREVGLAFVHQDLGLVPSLTVAENVRVRVLTDGRRRVSWARERRRTRELFGEFELDIDPGALVRDLPATQQALLAVVRAVDDIRMSCDGDDRGLLVLDETTVFLPQSGRDQLYRLMRTIANSLASVLFVSHDLTEVQQVTDRVTVLRDGRLVGTVVTREASEQRLVELIIGRALGAVQAAPSARDATDRRHPPISVRNLSGGVVRRASFELQHGETVGVTGLVGSGYDEVPYLMFGGERAESGEMEVDGRTLDLTAMTPARAVGEGMALIPADRLGDGSVGPLSVEMNASLQVLERYGPRRLRRRALGEEARRRLRTFDVRPDDPSVTYETLSGGNQQKVLLAKWLWAEPRILLLHEPTQGVDIGAREQIFHLVRAATDAGAAVLVASNDLEQLVAVCRRVLVFARGVPVRELTGPEITKERLAEESFALEPDARDEAIAR